MLQGHDYEKQLQKSVEEVQRNAERLQADVTVSLHERVKRMDAGMTYITRQNMQLVQQSAHLVQQNEEQARDIKSIATVAQCLQKFFDDDTKRSFLQPSASTYNRLHAEFN